MSESISVHAKVYLAPESVDRFLAAFKNAVDVAKAEPKCTFLEVYTNPEKPGEISWVENWDASVEWLMQNVFPKEELKPYFAAVEELSIKPRETVILKPLGTEWSKK